jgi:ATP-binding cassette subfamily B protein
MKRCSRIAGRERWHIRRLENNPRLAAAVQLVLQTEEGVLEARANPLTGRVLVVYDPSGITQPIATMLLRALEVCPLSPEEFSLFRPEPAAGSVLGRLIATEAACGLFHLFLLGGLCPMGLASTAAFLLVERVRHSQQRRSVEPAHIESAVTN